MRILVLSFLISVSIGVSSCGSVHVNVKHDSCKSRGVIDGEAIDQCDISKKVF